MGVCRNTYSSFICDCKQGFAVRNGNTMCEGNVLKSSLDGAVVHLVCVPASKADPYKISDEVFLNS